MASSCINALLLYTAIFCNRKNIIRTLRSCVIWIKNDMKWIKNLTTLLQKSLTSPSMQNLELQMLVFSKISVSYISWTSYWLFRSTRVFLSFFNPIYILFCFFLSYFYFNLRPFFKIFLEGIYLFLCRFFKECVLTFMRQRCSLINILWKIVFFKSLNFFLKIFSKYMSPLFCYLFISNQKFIRIFFEFWVGVVY